MLSHSIPPLFKSKPQVSQMELTVKRQGVLLSPVNSARIQFDPILNEDLTRLKEYIGAASGVKNSRESARNLRVRFADDRFIIRQLASLKLPNSKRKKMAQIDMLGSTPFAAEDVYLVHNSHQLREENATQYAVVKRSILDPILKQVSEAGYRVNDLKFGEHESGFQCDHESLKQILPNSRLVSVQRSMFSAALLLIAFGAAFTVGRANWRHIEAHRVLDEAIEVESAKASAVRRLIGQRNESLAKLTTVRKEKDGAVPIVVVLEELSRVVPDDTWITDLEINSGVVNLSGFSADAAKLIPKLEASDFFSEPAFRSPVLRVNVQVGERFSIVMKTKRGTEFNG